MIPEIHVEGLKPFEWKLDCCLAAFSHRTLRRKGFGPPPIQPSFFMVIPDYDQQLDWSVLCPTEPGVYFLSCMENDYTPEECPTVLRGKELFGYLDALWNPMKTWHDGLTDVKWARKP